MKAADFDRALEKAIEKEFKFSGSRSRVRRLRKRRRSRHILFSVNEPKYVTFLLEKPTAEAIAKAETYNETGRDQWAIIGT